MSEAVQNRKSRESETRVISTRPTSWRAPETLPSPNKREGITHRWIRTSMMGSADAQNISSKMREGWEPCKAEEYPELQMHATEEGRFKGNIEIGGLMLCSIPTEFMKQRAAHFANQNKAQMEAVDNNLMRENDPRMPLFKESSSKVTFGSGS
jgi:hypothetical protein